MGSEMCIRDSYHLINRVTIGARDSRILQYDTLADLPGKLLNDVPEDLLTKLTRYF